MNTADDFEVTHKVMDAYEAADATMKRIGGLISRDGTEWCIPALSALMDNQCGRWVVNYTAEGTSVRFDNYPAAVIHLHTAWMDKARLIAMEPEPKRTPMSSKNASKAVDTAERILIESRIALRNAIEAVNARQLELSDAEARLTKALDTFGDASAALSVAKYQDELRTDPQVIEDPYPDPRRLIGYQEKEQASEDEARGTNRRKGR